MPTETANFQPNCNRRLPIISDVKKNYGCSNLQFSLTFSQTGFSSQKIHAGRQFFHSLKFRGGVRATAPLPRSSTTLLSEGAWESLYLASDITAADILITYSAVLNGGRHGGDVYHFGVAGPAKLFERLRHQLLLLVIGGALQLATEPGAQVVGQVVGQIVGQVVVGQVVWVGSCRTWRSGREPAAGRSVVPDDVANRSKTFSARRQPPDGSSIPPPSRRPSTTHNHHRSRASFKERGGGVYGPPRIYNFIILFVNCTFKTVLLLQEQCVTWPETAPMITESLQLFTKLTPRHCHQ